MLHLLVLIQLHALQGSSLKYPSLIVKVELELGQIMHNSLKIYITVYRTGKCFGLYLNCSQMWMTV